MREDEWPGRQFDRLHRRTVTGVGTVDQHSQPVHFPNHRTSVSAQSGVFGFRAPVTNGIPRIVGKQHVGDAECIKSLDPGNAASKPVRSLQMKAYGELSVLLGLTNV